MGTVDAGDDTIRRWALHHYRFDPSRRERRNVLVAAYDDEDEFLAEFERCSDIVRSEIAAGIRSDREYVSGFAMEPGHLAASARGHDLRRAIEHGVDPAPLRADGLLPSNTSLISLREDPGLLPST